MRVWLPDRPGALGAVASRIGAVRGDLVGIDILERGAGRAIDELVVDLPDQSLLGLLVAEVSEVDGVDVEEVRPAGDNPGDPRLDALETAATLVEQYSVPALLATLVLSSMHNFRSSWAAVISPGCWEPVVSAGETPPGAWMSAFLAGSRVPALNGAEAAGPEDVAWSEMEGAGLAVLLGRAGHPFRSRERKQLACLARIADLRWQELALRPARTVHPASGRACG